MARNRNKLSMTPLAKARREIKVLEANARRNSESFRAEQAELERQLNSQRAELAQKNQVVIDKTNSIVRRDEEIINGKTRISELQKERDTIIRLVDQFTSLQITPLGTSTTQGIANSNSPKELRKT